jgi:hypothetical protein
MKNLRAGLLLSQQSWGIAAGKSSEIAHSPRGDPVHLRPSGYPGNPAF